MQSRVTKLYTCPECDASTDGKACRCGWTKPKKPILSSTAYIAKPPMTAEERGRSEEAMEETFQKLVKKYPAMFAGERWNKYRQPKQEEASDDDRGF